MTIHIVTTIIAGGEKRKRDSVGCPPLSLSSGARLLPGATMAMPSYYSAPFADVQSYMQCCEAPDLDAIRPPECQHCCGHTVLHSHGKYTRRVWSEEQEWRLPVFRFICAKPECKRTCSVLPSFVGRYERFSWDAQESVCTKVDEQHTLEEGSIPAPVGPLSARTVWRWVKRWRTYMDELEERFWQFVISLHPAVYIPRGQARPARRLRYWQSIWAQLTPKKVNVGLFHGLYHLRQSSARVAG